MSPGRLGLIPEVEADPKSMAKTRGGEFTTPRDAQQDKFEAANHRVRE